MKKETFEIYKYTELPSGYAHLGDNSPTDEDIMNKVIEFSKGKDIKIYKHFVRRKWVKNVNYTPHSVDDVKLLMGDEIWYLDIYYQEN